MLNFVKHVLLSTILVGFYFCSAQGNMSIYETAKKNYNAENYKQALADFQKAKYQFNKNNDLIEKVNCLNYISQIFSQQGDYSNALKSSNEALIYFERKNIINDSLYTEVALKNALSLKFLGDFQNAFDAIDSVIKYLEQRPNDNELLANAHQVKSRIEIDLGRYDSAIITAKKALLLNDHNSHVQQAALLNVIGVGFYFREQLDSTLSYYNKSYKLKKLHLADAYQMAITTYNIGIVYEDLGDYDKAIDFYNEAVQYDLSDRGEDIGFVSDIYLALANTYAGKNDLEKAEEFAQKALQLAIKKYGEYSPQISFVYQAYANIFELKEDYDNTMKFIEKSLDIFRIIYGNKHRWTADALISIAEIQVKLGQFVSADKNFKEAITIGQHINNSLIIANAEMGLGTIHLKTNQTGLAMAFFKSSKIRFLNAYDKNHETYLAVSCLEVECLFKNHQFEKAGKIIDNIKSSTEDANLFFHLQAVTYELGMALQNFEETGDAKLLYSTMSELDKFLTIIPKIRKEYLSAKSKIHANNGLDTFISKAIKAAYILYELKNESRYLNDAFKLSEINRGTTLIEGIRDVSSKKMTNLPKSLLDRERKMKSQLQRLKKEIYESQYDDNQDLDHKNKLLSAQLSLRKSLDSLLLKIEKSYPKYYQLKYSYKVVSIQTLRDSILKDDQTLIEYYIDQRDIYAFVITNKDATIKKLIHFDVISNEVDRFMLQIKNQQDITEQSQKLYRLLLSGLNIQTKRLIIIPDKQLNQLPFEALMVKGNFLVEEYLISYAGSANLLKNHNIKNKEQKKLMNWCGFAPKYIDDGILTSNQSEIEMLGKLMDGKIYTGNDATVDNFKSQSQNASILHLATHAEVNHDNPLYNKLLFAKDSTLTASEIYTMSIPTELAVLSACETGFGALEKSEGLMSMSRAFQYAGAKSTVMSLWKIPDKESAQLMVSFYNSLKKGLPKDEALQKAKLEYLYATDDETLKHPYYWSGFVISGDVTPIDTPLELWVWLLGLAILLAFSLLVFKLVKHFK